jgi:hypothetical protein
MKSRLAAAALFAILPLAAMAEAGPRTPAPFAIVPLVELHQAEVSLAAMRAEPAQAALDRAAAALARTQALAGGQRAEFASLVLLQVLASRHAVATMRDAEAATLVRDSIRELRAQPHY